MSEDTKRRLRLMPEVLPDPTQVSSGGAPRTRTIEHLRRLMALAATTAALAGCTKEDGEKPIRKDDDVTKKKSEPPNPAPSPSPSPSVVITDAAPPLPPTGPSYGVVDMLPPPAKCAGLAATVKASISWRGTFLELSLPKATRGLADRWSKTDPPKISAGTITKTTWSGENLVLEVTPNVGETYVYITLVASCTGGSEHVSVEVDLTSKAAPKVTLHDSYY